jgi:transposase
VEKVPLGNKFCRVQSSKIHFAADSYGLPIVFEVAGGDVHDSQAAPTLKERLPETTSIVADKGYDSQTNRDQIEAKGPLPVIPRGKNSKVGNADLDKDPYKLRHLVENTFCNLKQFRAIATRYDKHKRNFESMVALAYCLLWLPMKSGDTP